MKNQEILDTLSDCINHCNYCADACLGEDNVKMMVNCIRTDRACASVCTALADVLATGYNDVSDLVEYCARTCQACAQECEKHQHDHCQACAEACRKCAQACRSYAA